jgi:hypothetical protein
MKTLEEITKVVSDANFEYWEENRKRDIEWKKGNTKIPQIPSLPDLIAKRVFEALNKGASNE